ncbi:hypothetical protein Lal_00020099 [Lupinus albus]|uniref:Uncharacterized protein n=1 Tax=Lupinus albus TaxID=3870 RepID=A0A6A4Q7W0_LUPAL|nr:hypothetical protein Lalb_Chr08g0246221 [Lupinus albus]KAF1871307.1 hypothetical protein Lal_00020099 [Lupinus albus]
MDPAGVAFDKLKAFAKSSHHFFDDLFHRRNPIEILKRLQREAFSDIMKLRDRQEKVEKMLSFYKSSKNGPFQEDTTHVRGQVDFLGALLLMDGPNQNNLDAVNRSGIRTGVDSRFIFETTIGQKDTLVAEFLASQKGKEHGDDVLEMPLSLAKLSYTANVNDWLSVMAIPIGAQCRDVGVASNSFNQLGKGLTDVSSFGPPLLNLHTGSAIGITVRKSNVIGTLAQSIAGLGMSSGSDTMENRSSTFAQLVCQFPSGTKLSVMGLQQVPFSPRQHTKFGALTIPIVLSKQLEANEAVPEGGTKKQMSAGSIVMMVESELDGFTKLGGWLEMNKLNPKSVQWAVTMSDVYDDSFGWGMSLSGMISDSASRGHFQAESYLKFIMGNKFCLKPGLAYVKDGNSKIAALVLRSNWSL